MRRSVKQGRRPSGLGKPQLVRLYAADREKLEYIKGRLGSFYNENEIIRDAVRLHLESIYTELLKS